MIDGVRKVLGFETEETAAWARLGFAERTEWAGVKLYAGLGGPSLEGATGAGLVDAGGEQQSGGTGRASDDEVVIVASALAELVGASAERHGAAEVERRSFDRAKFAGGNQILVNDGVAIGVKVKVVTEDVAAAG